MSDLISSDSTKNSALHPSDDIFIFHLALNPSVVEQFDPTHSDKFLFDLIPAEDPNWRDASDHMNSPC